MGGEKIVAEGPSLLLLGDALDPRLKTSEV
jgi:hypothetical protein